MTLTEMLKQQANHRPLTARLILVDELGDEDLSCYDVEDYFKNKRFEVQ